MVVIMRAGNGNVVTISPAENPELQHCCWVEVRDANFDVMGTPMFCHSYESGWSKLDSLLDENE